jgi:hypothetical protein
MLCLKAASSGDEKMKEDIIRFKSEMGTDTYLEGEVLQNNSVKLENECSMLVFFTEPILLAIHRGILEKNKFQQR